MVQLEHLALADNRYSPSISLAAQQASVPKLERQTDLYPSTLRRFVEVARGTLELRIELPGKRVMHLTGVGDFHG